MASLFASHAGNPVNDHRAPPRDAYIAVGVGDALRTIYRMDMADENRSFHALLDKLR